ncbi:MAG: helicase-related protein [Elusimicrobiales bacterium]
MGDVYSLGKIDKALKDYSEVEGKKLIIVDEAHRFRNTETEVYKHLWLLCQGNYVLLLTATPFNNTPEDIESLLKLFTTPKKSTLNHIDNLSEEFKSLIKKYKDLKKTSKTEKMENIKEKADEIAKRIRYIISPITIRRTREDLKKTKRYKEDLERQGIDFPYVNPPDVVPYSFKELDNLYIKTVEKFIESEDVQCSNCFKAARYKTISYISDDDYRGDIAVKYTGAKTRKEAVAFIEQSQKNLSSLIRRIFVKRFESSFGSFSKSIDDYINSHLKIKEYYEKGKIPIYKNIGNLPSISEIENMDEEEREEIMKKIEELAQTNELIWVDSKKISKTFIKDLENDIQILKEIKNNWAPHLNEPHKYDYKLKELIKILKDKISKNEKVIIFSEYSDTVDYLAEQLKKENFRIIKYDSSCSDSLKEEIKNNFDASKQEHFQKNDYDILITTDVLSEGINLHRANNIINYDIPYNPTRVIQRIGRINRVSKTKLKDIFIHNFFPTKIGEGHTNIKNISTLKMYMIHFLLGEDAQYLTTDEEIKSFFYDEFKKSVYFEEESWDVKYRNILYDVEQNHHIEKPFPFHIGPK